MSIQTMAIIIGCIIGAYALYMIGIGVRSLFKKYKKVGEPMRDWAGQHQFSYHANNKRAIRKRLESSPGKYFRRAKFLLNWNYPWYQYPYIQGNQDGIPIWAYKMYGADLHDDRFTGWAIEVASVISPVSLTIQRVGNWDRDEINTESRDFEKNYSVDVHAGEGTLQLLDPVMIELITHSGIPTIEFSDQSVVGIFHSFPPTVDQLEQTLEILIKMSHQLGHNFPKST